MHPRCLLALAGTFALAGCTVEVGGGPATALFTVPRGGELAEGADFFALPFPHDFWRPGDGAAGLDLSLYPTPSAILEDYLAVIPQRLDGFGLNAAIFARFDAAIDPASLPATPEEAQAPTAAVYLVDVDPASPDRGSRWPLRLGFEPRPGETIGPNWLSALPYPGFPLAEGRTYALVVTTRVRGEDGTPVRSAADWQAVSGAAAPADPDLARARTAVAPLLAWLDEPGGDERADVATAAVFTTQRATELMGKLRARVWELEAPVVRDVTGTGETADYLAYQGLFDAPNFQSGEVPYTLDGGEIVLDEDDGLPVVQRQEALRVAFTVPLGEPPDEGWPVALYAHGTGGSYRSFQNDGTARRLAREGIAVISIDQVLHGPRNPGQSPEISFFNFQNPLAARDNTLQGAADDFSLLRLVLGLVHVDEERGVTVRFDPERIYFFGHSQGGLTGPPFVAYEPRVRGAVLSGAGGLIYLSLLHKTEPVDITTLVKAIIRDRPLDELNPTLALVQTWIERADPVNYAPLLARTPPAGPTGAPMAPKHVYQSEGLIDDYTPPLSIEALATAIGGHLVAPELQPLPGLGLRGRSTLSAPVTGNLDGTTVVLLQYAETPGSDGHFVVFDVPAAQRQSARFLGSLAETGTATLVEP
jgi:dienelactone hydrolase